MVTIHKLQSQSAQENVLIHLIPPTLPYQLELDQLVQRLYSRIKVGIDRSHTHAGVHHRQQGIPLRKYIAEPSYCLSPPSLSSRKISFTHTPTSQTTLDVTNRHTFLHVGYGLSPCQRWIVACCVDERGENGEVGVWARGSKSCEEGDGDARDKDGSDLDKIWNFTMRFAEQANVEWRIVIARFGVMDRGELDGALLYSFFHSILNFVCSLEIPPNPAPQTSIPHLLTFSGSIISMDVHSSSRSFSSCCATNTNTNAE